MQHTNKLVNSSSQYLLQHAHNPVNWNTWSEEILQKSIDEDKPILVSIGYSSCHWCHVMEKESFEDEATAAIMNKYFINIKIDREERPDLDHIYMDALQTMTGSGGWPLNVFLTPQLKPFYGGTYFPPKPINGRMSWIDTLEAVNKAFINRRDDIESQASKLTNHLISSNSFSNIKVNSDDTITEKTLETIADNILKNADTKWGGFGKAPKFPQTSSIQYLLRQYHFTKNTDCLNQALLSLDKMISGGIYDQIGGGFSRYSTDERWFAPHFEKMLYDNALLVITLAEAYQITNKELYADTIKQTLNFVEREMMSNEFAFYSAFDADSEGIEGKYYTWSREEIEKILVEDASLFCDFYNVSETENWEQTNILFRKKSLEEFASLRKIDVNELEYKFQKCCNKLLQQRNSRVKPSLDDKTITAWNAMMNVAYSKAYAATGNEHYKSIAENNMNLLLSKIYVDENLFHCYKNGGAYIGAFLDDYAYLIWALIHLQEISGDTNYILKAYKLLNQAIEKFSDTNSVFFIYTQNHQKDVVVKKIDIYDGAIPSANSIMAFCMNYLASIFYNENLRKRFLAMTSGLKTAVVEHPNSFAFWALLVQSIVHSMKEIVVTGEGSNSVITDILNKVPLNRIFISSSKIPITEIPILKDKRFGNEINYYICENQTCKLPEKDLAKFLHLYNI